MSEPGRHVRSGTGRLRRWRKRLGLAVALTAVVSVLGLLWLVRASGVPVISPVYQIETVSNGYSFSLPLNMGRPGVPAVPRPIDVNHDGIQDVIVAMNLVDAKALLGLPPNADEVLAPTLEITRNPAAVALCRPDISLLKKCTPPLKIQIKMTVQDSGNLSTQQVIRFGYDTGNNGGVPGCATPPCTDNKGRIGSIPPYFKATLLGLADFFNPLSAVVTTHGYAVVGTPLINDEVRNGYEGPLDLVGSIGDAPGILEPGGGIINPNDVPTSELRIGYRPWPGNISLSYLSDDEGQHIVYDHQRMGEVDVNTHVGVFSREDDILSSNVLEARIDRMPRHVELDLQTADRAGRIAYRARPDGRLPDVRVSDLSETLQVVPLPAPPPTPDVDARLKARLAGFKIKAHAALFVGLNDPDPEVQLVPIEPPLLADVDVEGFPDTVEGRWSFPDGGPVSALFCGGEVDEADQCQPSGQGVGAADAHIQDFYAAPTVVSPFTPREQQYLSFRNAPGGVFESESLIAGRIEQIRELRFDQSAQGFSARTRLGDGELPLQTDFGMDTRSGDEGFDLKAVATVAPLPDDITFSLTQPGEDQKVNPLKLVYESSRSVDVDAHVEVREATAAAGAACGRTGTICGDMRIRHIPAKIEVKVATFPSQMNDINPGEDFDDTRVSIDTTPRPLAPRPDFFADLTLGQEDATPANSTDDIPLIAHGEMLGLPPHVRVRAREGNDATLDRVEFHTCDRDFDANPPVCAAGTDDAQGIGALKFNLRNWTTRPVGLPILVPSTPLWGTVAVRGRTGTTDVDFEAAAQLTNVREVQYRNTGNIFGIQTRVGADKDFSAKIDMGNVEFPDDDPANGRIDATGEATISPLPGLFNLCFRSAHEKIQTLSDTFTDACETDAPFTKDPDNNDALSESPTTVHYCGASFTSAACPDGTEGFDIAARVLLRQRGTNAGVADDHTIRGRLDLTNLPNQGTVNFQSPKEDDGDDVEDPGEKDPIRGQFDATAGSPVKLQFGVEVTDGDLVCEDPRTPGIGKKALCAAGIIQNLPTNAFFKYDTNVHQDNLLVNTNTQIDITDLRLSSVEGARKCSIKLAPCYLVSVPKVLVADADINDLPSLVTGTLDLPTTEKDEEEAPTIDITATPAIGGVDATVQNFIAPNPFVKPIPTRIVSGFGAPTQTATFRQRGESFLATAHIEDVRGFGYRTVKAEDGTPLETKVIKVDFGSGTEVIRAYADIMESPASQTIADAQLNDIPAGLQFCFRGDANTESPAEGTETYCDVGDDNIPVPNTDGKDQASGAIQFEGTPDTPGASPLDVDAFVRHASGGGTQVLAGRVNIKDIPFVVEGTIPTGADDGELDVGGFRRDGTNLVPDGINRIEAQVASFDLATADTGFTGELPYEPRFNNTAPFPVAGSAKQHLKAALVDDDFHARLRIGEESQIQRVQMLRTFCPTPANEPPDYPRFPSGANDKYTCIKGIFNPSVTDSDPAGGFDDQLDLQFHMQEGPDVISVNDAGITDIPSNFQVTIAETPLFEGAGENLRQRCGTVSEGEVNGGNCMPPLLRFDQPNDSVLWGTARMGTVGDLSQLELSADVPIVPRAGEKIANLDEGPTATSFPNWGSPPAGVPANLGIRAKIVGFKGGRTAVKAGIRLAIPKSLTVDQVQSWSDSNSSSKAFYWEASDTRFHYVVRDAAGNPVGSLGQLALMKQSDDGTQILASGPCLSAYGPRADDPGDCNGFLNGLSIPGELGIDIYQRNHTGQGKDYMQIDGRLSQLKNTSGNNVPFHLSARVVGGGPKPSIGRLEAEVKNVPQGVSSNDDPTDPSFRLRVEMLGEGETPPTAGGGGGGGGGEEEENCGVFLCALTDVRLKSIFALVDFKPSGAGARRVEAVVNQKGATSQGVEIKSFDEVDGGSATPVLVKALLDVNPINVFLHAGLPLIGGADFVLMSQLQAGLTLNTEHFTLRHNTLHVEASNRGPNKSVVGPINYYIYLMHGSAYALFVKLFGVDFLPPSAPPELGHPPGPPAGPVQLVFLSCDAGDLFSQLLDIGDTVIDPFGGSPLSNALEIGATGGVSPNDDRNVVIWPLLDPRIHFSGAFGFLGNIAKIIGPFFCFTDTGASEIPLFGTGVPGDPVGSNFLPAHSSPPDTADGSVPGPGPGPGPGTLPAPPNFDDTGNLSLCGTHVYTNLTIDNTLTVANAASSAENSVPGRADCAPGAEGTLNIVADQVTVNGTITASGIIPVLQPDGTPPSGNSGGGHGGEGGDGSSGSGGTTYDDVDADGLDNVSGNDDDGRPTLVGGRGRGGGDNTSHGGGSIEIQARDVTVGGSGQIIARGANGNSGAAGSGASCTGAGTGDGGGSGGRIVISAFDVDNNGTISVSGGFGGDGGNGGGGGGGAGRLIIGAPLMTGESGVFGDGRTGGVDTCTANGDDDGGEADDWNVDKGPGEHIDTSPMSTIPALPQFWNRDESGANLELPFEAAVEGGGDNGAQIVICGYRKAPEDIDGTGSLNDEFPIKEPFFNGISLQVCGNGGQVIASHDFTADRDGHNLASQGSDLGNGYWGVWSIAFSPPDPDYDCTDGSVFDFFVCLVEPFPEDGNADLVFGIDNSDPSLTVTPGSDPGHDFVSNSGIIKLTNAATDQTELSNLRTVECSNDGTNFVTCNNGANDWPLATGADGARTVTVQAIDFAGNVTTVTRDGLLDTTLPTQTANFINGTLTNTWYQVRPTVQLDGSDPGGAAASGLASPAFHYKFDDGSEEACSTGVPCDIDAGDVNALFVGQHIIHFTAQDIAGNRRPFDHDHNPDTAPLPMLTKALKLDDEKPLSAYLTVPRVPNGANGWFAGRPWVTFSAVDQPGASGLTGNASAGIFYSLNGLGGPFTKFSQPFQLLPGGPYTICWYSKDVAGNQEDTHCTNSLPSTPLDQRSPKVDDAAPAVTITAPAPNGSNGWFTTSPAVTVAGADNVPGSTINPAFDPDLTDLCNGKIPVANPTTPSGVCISLDGLPFAPQTPGLITVQEGLHTIQAFSIDVSGQKSPVVEAAYMVDRSAPVTAARVMPPAPALAPWWRRLPRVVLRSTDGELNSNVQKIEYFVDGVGPTLYTVPFEVPAGVHTITFKATDRSGRVETLRTLPIKTDIGPPVVRALTAKPTVFVPAKGDTTTLKWTVTDDLSHKVTSMVIVYNALGLPVRRIQDVPRAITPNTTTTFTIKWDGKDDGLAGVLPGPYYYRVVVTDEAGNISQTGESAPLTVKAI